MAIFKPIKRYFNRVTAFAMYIRNTRFTLCRVEGIDLQKQEVRLFNRTNKAFIKLSFADLIDDTGLLSQIPSTHACWIGYYYGIIYQESVRAGNVSANRPQIILKQNRGKYSFRSHILRGPIVYIDLETRQTHRELPLDIVRNEYVLMNFDQTQACYIGILAGIEYVKSGKKHWSKRSNVPPILRIVK
ncbi:MAG: hypothetical protein KIT27_03625 [Legionellales bacterium]|nr:hypothetical protein [Legionellales bacterium]